MSRVLADSLTHAFAMYEKLFSKKKIFVSENSLDNLRYQNPLDNPSKLNPLDKPLIRFVGQPFDIIYWTTIRYNLFIGQPSDIIYLLDNPPISNLFIGKPSNIKFIQNPCHALTPVSRNVPVHMKCNMPIHVNSCYMHDDYHMQH